VVVVVVVARLAAAAAATVPHGRPSLPSSRSLCSGGYAAVPLSLFAESCWESEVQRRCAYIATLL
jgi:hypothetical protein